MKPIPDTGIVGLAVEKLSNEASPPTGLSPSRVDPGTGIGSGSAGGGGGVAAALGAGDAPPPPPPPQAARATANNVASNGRSVFGRECFMVVLLSIDLWLMCMQQFAGQLT